MFRKGCSILLRINRTFLQLLLVQLPITGFFHQIISPSFSSSYVANCERDAALLHELFAANKEPQPDIIVYPHQTEMYKDVTKDKKANDNTIAALKFENPTIANLLIDYFDANTKWKHIKCVYNYTTVYQLMNAMCVCNICIWLHIGICETASPRKILEESKLADELT